MSWDEDVSYTGSASAYVEEIDSEEALEWDTLEDFAENPPAADNWVYEGWGAGAHVLAWHGHVRFTDEGDDVYKAVRFHVHPGAAPPQGANSAYGSMWAEGRDGSININNQVGTLTGLNAVWTRYFSDMFPNG